MSDGLIGFITGGIFGALVGSAITLAAMCTVIVGNDGRD